MTRKVRRQRRAWGEDDKDADKNTRKVPIKNEKDADKEGKN